MLVRLLVALLTLALALPAMAMPLCHAPEASAKAVVEHAGHARAMAMPDDSAPEAPTKPNPHAGRDVHRLYRTIDRAPADRRRTAVRRECARLRAGCDRCPAGRSTARHAPSPTARMIDCRVRPA